MSIAIVRAEDSYNGTKRVLELIKNEIYEKVGGRERFLIKPNFVSTYTYLSATPRETVEAILEFIHNNFNVSEIIIAESPAIGSAWNGFKNYGYYELKKRFGDIELADLDDYDYKEIELVDEYGKTFRVPISSILLDNRYVRISPCRAKTHDTVIVTLSIKNIVVGSIRRGYKSRIHRGYYTINYAIAKLATYIMSDLGVVDGVEAMEGNGPVAGDPKRWGVVFASINPVNLDIAVSYGMGFDPHDIGYLYLLANWGYGELDVSKIRVVGESLESIRTKFKPHSTYRDQLSWKKFLAMR